MPRTRKKHMVLTEKEGEKTLRKRTLKEKGDKRAQRGEKNFGHKHRQQTGNLTRI